MCCSFVLLVQPPSPPPSSSSLQNKYLPRREDEPGPEISRLVLLCFIRFNIVDLFIDSCGSRCSVLRFSFELLWSEKRSLVLLYHFNSFWGFGLKTFGTDFELRVWFSI